MVFFREIQRFRQPWLWVLLLAMAAWSTWALWKQLVLGEPLGSNPMRNTGLLVVWALAALGLPGLFLVARLQTEVRSDGLHVRFAPFHLRTRSFRLADLVRFEAVTYNPILEYGGWGIRIGARGWAYNVSGRLGVRLTFVSGKQLLIGSRDPEAFVAAVTKARAEPSPSANAPTPP